MMFSIYRQGKPVGQLDHLCCIDAATTADDIDMIMHSFLHKKPTIVGLEGEVTIVKPLESGDDKLSFIELYDTALSLREYKRLRKHGVRTTAEYKPVLYQVTLIAEINFNPRVQFMLKAMDEHAGRRRVEELINDEAFREELTKAMVAQIIDAADVRMADIGLLKVGDPAPADSPEWEFTVFPE